MTEPKPDPMASVLEEVRGLREAIEGHLRLQQAEQARRAPPEIPRLRNGPPRRLGLRGLLGSPAVRSGVAENFQTEIPHEFWQPDGDDALVSCPCGETPVVGRELLAECDCGRWFLFTGAAVWVWRPPADDAS